MNQPPTPPMRPPSDVALPVPHKPVPNIRSIFLEFLLIGLVSFGGGIMAYERRLLLEKRKWLSNDEFMAILAMGQTMPGLNSVNLAMLSGDRIRGLAGAVAAVIGVADAAALTTPSPPGLADVPPFKYAVTLK